MVVLEWLRETLDQVDIAGFASMGLVIKHPGLLGCI
jgi:hypothetical protein